jgi:type VI secretion system protein ImpA
MPLRDDLLTPIAGDNPAGASLRYDRVYDQIKEARTEDDDSLPTGAWERQSKRADFKVVAKLAGEALANRSKDLHLAVWLGEALLKQEGISPLTSILQLCLDLQQNFWETLYPEIDEGDPGMRVVPLQWAANRYAALVYGAGLTLEPINFFEYKAARVVGREEDANNSEQQREVRAKAIADGKLTSEEVDEAIAATPKAFYVALDGSLVSAIEVLRELDVYCEEHYGQEAPSFRKLREALEEVQNLVGSLLRDKRRLEPDQVEDTSGGESEREIYASDGEASSALTASIDEEQRSNDQSAQAPSHSASKQPLRSEKRQTSACESWDDALDHIETAVTYMGGQDPSSPLAFLLRSSMRLAELRGISVSRQMEYLIAPSSELRQALKGVAGSGDWLELHRQSFEALGTPCGRGWLDLYRYLWTSCRAMGWEAQQLSIAVAMQQILRELPDLREWTLNDDTPVANAETMRWLAEEIAPPIAHGNHEEEHPAAAPVAIAMPVVALVSEGESSGAAEAEDLFHTAQELAARGQVQSAIQMLARDAEHQSIGRLRYSRNLQIAELCLQSGNSAVAVPMLQELIREVEDRKLESWEPRGIVAKPYVLLLQCASAVTLDAASLFARLCAIDPSVALAITPPAQS